MVLFDTMSLFSYFCAVQIKKRGIMRMVKYLLSHQLDYSWGISTSTVGLQEVPPGAEYPFGEHLNYYLFSTKKGRVLSDEIHILYLLKGGGFFVSAHCPKTHIQAGDAIILFPHEWHNYAPDEDTGWEEAWVGFSGDFVQRIIKSLKNNTSIFHILL